MEPKVLLGLLDEEVKNGETTYMSNKIGGKADYPSQITCDAGTCAVCGCRLLLVCQVYCPLEGSDQHRTLYVFACINRACWNKQASWKVLRCQARDTSFRSRDRPKSTVTKTTQVDDWGTGTDDWGDEKATDWGSEAAEWGSEAAEWGSEAAEWGSEAAEWGSEAAEWGNEAASGKFKASDNDIYQKVEGTTDTGSSRCLSENISDLVEGESHVIPEGRQDGDHVNNKRTSNSDHVTSVVEGHSVCRLESDSLGGDVIEIPNGNKSELQIVSDMENINIGGSNQEQSSATIVSGADNVFSFKDSSIVTYLKTEQHHTVKDSVNTSVDCRGLWDSDDVACLRAYHVNVLQEPEAEVDECDAHARRLLRDYAASGCLDFNPDCLEDSQPRGQGREGYERAHVPHGDKLFHRFQKRVARCPQQILRYQYGGTALPLSLENSDVIPACQSCGNPRIFELQLMPGLVGFLKMPNSTESALEFGTAMVYTCKASCWRGVAAEEFIVVQPDPDQHLYKT